MPRRASKNTSASRGPGSSGMEPVQVIEASAPGRSGEMPPADAGPVGSDEDIGLLSPDRAACSTGTSTGWPRSPPKTPPPMPPGAQRLINEGYLPPTD